MAKQSRCPHALRASVPSFCFGPAGHGRQLRRGEKWERTGQAPASRAFNWDVVSGSPGEQALAALRCQP
jgi:hypothetical protein